jgi:hypothetical protein
MPKDSALPPTPALGAQIPTISFSCRNSGYIIFFKPPDVIIHFALKIITDVSNEYYIAFKNYLIRMEMPVGFLKEQQDCFLTNYHRIIILFRYCYGGTNSQQQFCVCDENIDFTENVLSCIFGCNEEICGKTLL